MTRMILTGILALGTGALCMTAQQAPPATPAPAGQAAPAPAAPTGPAPKSQEEAQAVMALQQAAADPDAAIKAAEDLLTRFADTQFKEMALVFEADAYRRKNDWVKAEVYAERALETNPKSVQSHMMIAELITQHIGERDLDKADKLAKAEKHVGDAMAALKTMDKPNPQLSDADWEAAKKYVEAQAHNDLGLIAINRKAWDTAITEFKAAMAGDPQQGAYQARLAHTYQQAGKNTEAIAECDKMLADPNLNPQIKTFVNSVRAAAVKAGGPSAAPEAK